jgi:transcriptional regulator GlxA family with amidase domain
VIEAVVLDPAADHSLEAMAERAHFSVRHLSRLFEEQLGVSGAQFVERVRVETARALLEGSDEGVAVIAKRTGFRSEETLRRAFMRELGVSPGAYRSRFRTTGVQPAANSTTVASWPTVAHRVPVASSSN